MIKYLILTLLMVAGCSPATIDLPALVDTQTASGDRVTLIPTTPTADGEGLPIGVKPGDVFMEIPLKAPDEGVNTARVREAVLASSGESAHVTKRPTKSPPKLTITKDGRVYANEAALPMLPKAPETPKQSHKWYFIGGGIGILATIVGIIWIIFRKFTLRGLLGLCSLFTLVLMGCGSTPTSMGSPPPTDVDTPPTGVDPPLSVPITFAWDPPNEGHVEGYKLYIDGEGQEVGNTLIHTINVPPGEHRVFITAYNSEGESDPSNEVLFNKP